MSTTTYSTCQHCGSSIYVGGGSCPTLSPVGGPFLPCEPTFTASCMDYLAGMAEQFKANEAVKARIAAATGRTIAQVTALVEASAREGGGRAWAK